MMLFLTLTIDPTKYPYGMVMSSTHNGTTNDDAEKFNYQSKERDIESGYDYFEARLYDSATGRFLQVDPLAEKFPTFNSYAGMAANPIRLVDYTGMAPEDPKRPGDVVVVFAGGNWNYIDALGSTEEIVQNVKSGHTDQLGGSVQNFSSDYWSTLFDINDEAVLDGATQDAFDYVLENLDPGNGGRVVITGYSQGGVLANHLTERLSKENISVDLLVLVDAASATNTEDVSREVSGNAAEVINIYQTNASKVGSHGGAVTSKNPNTKITNSNYTNNYTSLGEVINHGNIDETTNWRVIMSVIKKLDEQQKKDEEAMKKEKEEKDEKDED